MRMRKRGYRFFQLGFFILLAMLAVMVYCNYDYWVFKLLIADNYVFTDTLDAVYAHSIGAENVKGYHSDFDRMVISLVTEKIRAEGGDYYTYLYTPRGYAYSKDSEKADAQTAYYEPLTADAVYLYLPNISKLTRQFVYESKEALAEYPYLILDLRGNYGGLLADFYRIAYLFTEEGAVLGYEQMRSKLLTHAVKSKNEKFFDFKKIIILQNGDTASAAEGLILALKHHVPQVTLLGATTFGKGIGQVTIPLTQGYALRATALLVAGPDGESIHLSGINPDIPADGEPDGAGLVEQALALLPNEP